MTENTRAPVENVTTGRDKDLNRLDEDLEIMERYAEQMDRVEDGIQDEMKRWDREFKDSHLHSTPKPRKHQR
jgi:hypothetical protein